MKILLINGSPNSSGATMRALTECKKTLSALGAECALYNIGIKERYACCACGGCKETKKCIFGDIDELAALCDKTDALIIGTPTQFGIAPGNLLSVLSRLVYSSRSALKYKPIAVIGVGRRGCISEAISTVKKFFEFSCCPLVSGTYPAMLYAKGKESAEKDAEGLKNMRSISKNLFFVTRCIEFAKENGIAPPEEETDIKTDISSIL
jgi:multimeric flavodoxin WrbA